MIAASPVLTRQSKDLTEIVFAKDQPEYRQLPAVLSGGEYGRATFRFKLSIRERLDILFGGNIYLQTLTFNRPLQPVKILTVEPDLADCL